MRACVAGACHRKDRLSVGLLCAAVCSFAALSPFSARAQQTGAGASYQGSVVGERASAGVRALSFDEAIQMGLKYNLGLILAGQSVRTAGGQRLQALQPLLPTAEATAREAVEQTNLQAEGLRIPGFPAIIGPFGFTDIRASVQWSLMNLSSLQSYLASKHNFAGASLSAQDAKDLVVLTVGNAYLLCISDAARVQSAQAEVKTAKLSLDQANENHEAGTAPRLDVLRAQVDYQTEQQSLIVAQNRTKKDKLALARAIGLPLEQEFTLTDQAPFASLGTLDANAAVAHALASRQDLKALQEEVKAAKAAKSAATAERYPTISAEGDYGVIGPTLGHSHGTYDASATASVPLFEEAKLRGDAAVAQSQLDQEQARLNDLRGQIDAAVRDSILDIQAADRQVQVARSSRELAREALSEAQLRYSAGVADNLAVSQAQASMAQADQRYIASSYEYNVAKLALARALGVAQTDYKHYVGGK